MRRNIILNLTLALGIIALVLFLFVLSGNIQESVVESLFSDPAPADMRPYKSEISTDRTGEGSPAVGGSWTVQDRPGASASADTTPFRLAVAPIVSPEASLVLYHDLAAYIGDKLGRSGQLMLRSTYPEINDLLKNRKCDLALVCAYPFSQGEREFGMKALVIPVFEGRRTYHSSIIVPAASRDQSLLDLRGKKFASATLVSFSGWIYPAHWLKKRGHDPFHFFREHILIGSHDRAVQAVADGYADGAAVVHMVYAQMPADIRRKTKVIGQSEPFGMPPFCVHPDIDPKLRDAIQSIMIHMHETPDGRRILANLKFDRFEVPDRELYRTLREFVREWELP